jgi:MFS family permease
MNVSAPPKPGYRSLVAPPGRRTMVLSGWLGRFPKSAFGLGTVLLVAGSSGDYALSGATAAVLSIALAVVGPRWSRAMDRHGQHRVLPLAALALALSTSALLVAVLEEWPVWTWLLAAALTGASVADSGAAVRTRWTALEPPGPLRQRAFALESVLDELVFVLSPPIVTVLGAAVHPALGVVVALALGVPGQLLLAAQRRTAPSPRAVAAIRASLLPPARILPVVIAFAGLGAVFGTLDVSTVALATEAGSPWVAGVAIGVFSLASVVSGVLVGARPAVRSERRRFIVAAMAFGLLVPAMAFAGGPWWALAIGAVAGWSVSPLMITGLSLVASRADDGRMAESLTYPPAAIAIGTTSGAALAGLAVDAGGGQAGYLVTAAAAALLATTAILAELAVGRGARR